MNAAVYVRVSSDEQARHGYSLAAQYESCAARALALGAASVVRYADEGVSGAVISRPGLDSLRDAARSGLVDLVVVMDPDRLSRDLAHQLLITEDLEKAGVRLEFVNFEWKDTPEGHLFYALKGAISQYEKAKIRERTAMGRRQRARAGKMPSGFEPYGYRYDRVTGLLEPDPVEAVWVARIFAWLNDGLGPGAIADRLNSLGVPRKRGGLRWHRSVIRRILANRAYTGVFYANRYDCSGVSLNPYLAPADRARSKLRAKAEWIEVPAPRLVGDEVFAAAQARLESARRLWAGAPRAPYILSGLVVCGSCARPMTGHTSTDWGVQSRWYDCKKSGGRGCGRRVRAGEVEALVWTLVVNVLGAAGGLWDEILSRPDIESLRASIEELGLMLRRIESARESLLRCVSAGLLQADESVAALRACDSEAAGVRDRLRDSTTRLHSLEAEAYSMGEALRGSAGSDPAAWPSVLEAMDPDSRRAVVRELVTGVRVEWSDGRRAPPRDGGRARTRGSRPSRLVLSGPLAQFARPVCAEQRNPDAPAVYEEDPDGGVAVRPDRSGQGR
ncbi:MAG: recombinase family protein [Firmicutes bacterium]|nr:recombinase family protein [Bacillota bacterium]